MEQQVSYTPTTRQNKAYSCPRFLLYVVETFPRLLRAGGHLSRVFQDRAWIFSSTKGIDTTNTLTKWRAADPSDQAWPVFGRQSLSLSPDYVHRQPRTQGYREPQIDCLSERQIHHQSWQGHERFQRCA